MTGSNIIVATLSDEHLDSLHPLVDEFASTHRSLRFKDAYWTSFRDWLVKKRNDQETLAVQAVSRPSPRPAIVELESTRPRAWCDSAQYHPPRGRDPSALEDELLKCRTRGVIDAYVVIVGPSLRPRSWFHVGSNAWRHTRTHATKLLIGFGVLTVVCVLRHRLT